MSLCPLIFVSIFLLILIILVNKKLNRLISKFKERIDELQKDYRELWDKYVEVHKSIKELYVKTEHFEFVDEEVRKEIANLTGLIDKLVDEKKEGENA